MVRTLILASKLLWQRATCLLADFSDTDTERCARRHLQRDATIARLGHAAK